MSTKDKPDIPASNANYPGMQHRDMENQVAQNNNPGAAGEIADAWRQIGQQWTDVSVGLQIVNTGSEAQWSGTAASAARDQFSKFQDAAQQLGQQHAIAGGAVELQTSAAATAMNAMPKPVPYDPGQMIKDAARTGNPLTMAALLVTIPAQKNKSDDARNQAVQVMQSRDTSLHTAASSLPAFTDLPTTDDGSAPGQTPGQLNQVRPPSGQIPYYGNTISHPSYRTTTQGSDPNRGGVDSIGAAPQVGRGPNPGYPSPNPVVPPGSQPAPYPRDRTTVSDTTAPPRGDYGDLRPPDGGRDVVNPRGSNPPGFDGFPPGGTGFGDGRGRGASGIGPRGVGSRGVGPGSGAPGSGNAGNRAGALPGGPGESAGGAGGRTAAGSRGAAGQSGMGAAGGGRGGRGEEDLEHRSADYLIESEDIWGDGELVAPPVIGE
ncbi:hypothetical protein F0L68_13935 [Solihabitans fulvus]|uniref:PPE family protein n=1 Tax=Solihabitans fulvus TaxID=1892852 RepID=A0A5B2XH51_9PSEU|nr:hypothetical protein [Solihabitans fulvus]KAA2262365.1 hypothetical protein F0L68_13935 [Solihabitans fulvus]